MKGALSSPTYRRFWVGSFAANLGLWIHSIALGWLVYDITRKAGWLGAVSFVGNAPTLVLGLVGGVIVDRRCMIHPPLSRDAEPSERSAGANGSSKRGSG